jgi:thiol-disulfide isomerase/thioredoxin
MVRRLALLALAGLSVAWSAGAAEPQRHEWPRQRPTPDLALPKADGSAWRLSTLSGQPVLLNFWASWCEPCRVEMPSLERLARGHEAQGLQVVAVNYREGDDSVQRFVESTGLHLPVLVDRDGTAAKALGVRAFPSTVAIDREGRARFTVLGECDWESPVALRWLAAIL